MIHEQPVFEVLAGVREVQPEHLGVATRGVVGDGSHYADQVTTERQGGVLDGRVAADQDVVVRQVNGVVGPVLLGHERQVRAVADHDLDVLG